MKHFATTALLLVLGLGCGGGAEPKTPPKIDVKPDAPVPVVKAEPEHIQVAHILISFAGTKTAAKRSKADAEKLANDVLARVKKGEDFDKLMKDLSDDPGAGVYMLCNNGVKKNNPDEYPRSGMVPAFGDVGFKLDVGGVGMSTFDAEKSPYGWHIIKRLK